MRAAELRDGQSGHIFHGVERLAVCSQTAFEQRCDVRVMKTSKNFPLALKTLTRCSDNAAVQHFEGNRMVEVIGGSLGEVNRTHAPCAYQSHKSIDSDLFSQPFVLIRIGAGQRVGNQWAHECHWIRRLAIFVTAVLSQQTREITVKVGGSGRQVSKKQTLLFVAQVKRLIQ